MPSPARHLAVRPLSSSANTDSISQMTSQPATAPAGVALAIAGVTKRFGDKQALAGVSLELRAGECLGLLGPNGAGKSTLVRCVVARVLPDAGSISVLGADARSAAARAVLGYVPQELALYPLLTARENLLVFGRYQGLQGGQLRDAIAWSLEWASLQDRANSQVREYSGGMKRRLNMAAGLLTRPRIILLDEPTVGVDPQSRERIYEMIAELRRGGSSMVYTTHYMEEAERLCDRIAIIDHGRVIAQGARDELVRNSFGGEAELIIQFAAPFAGAGWATAHAGRVDGNTVRFHVTQPAIEVAQLLEAARVQGFAVQDLSLKSPNLESVFLQLTGRGLRE